MLAEEAEEEMVEFAMGGVCNCCLDEQNKAYFIENDGVEFTIKCLSRYCRFEHTSCSLDEFLPQS